MVQWMNHNRNNSFVIRTQLPLLCEKCEAILLSSASGSYVRQCGISLAASQMLVDFKILYGLDH